ncbi:MAG: DUF2249 domain-containing protein [Mesorhizobium sp.]
MMVYDVRRLASANKDSAILSMFDGLHTGEAVQVVCDFDPSRLERKFRAFFAEGYEWTCLRSGPPDWQIEIGKISTFPECGCK